MNPTPPKTPKLREKIITEIEDRFVHTLELRLDEDIPDLADGIEKLVAEECAKARLEGAYEAYQTMVKAFLNGYEGQLKTKGEL